MAGPVSAQDLLKIRGPLPHFSFECTPLIPRADYAGKICHALNLAQTLGVAWPRINVMLNTQSCPLCESPYVDGFFADKSREYLRCKICALIFVPVEFHLSLADEKSVYDLHQNSPSDEGYRRFLSRLFEPLNQIISERFESPADGLDFGSGPGPTLSLMFQEAGHCVSIYDPFCAPDESALGQQYDFVTATEVVEHFKQPAKDLQRVWSLVKPGGVLGLMTKLAIDQEAFSDWHYKNDQTHVAFYSRATFEWLAQRWNAELEFIDNDVIVLHRMQ